MSNIDPGGNSGHEPDFSGLQQNFSQQQAKITALKELVRSSESNKGKNNQFAQEKVKNIAQRLTHLKTKATRSRQLSSASVERFDEHHIPNILEEESDSSLSMNLDTSLPTLPSQKRRSETPSASEKFNILRKSINEKRLLMDQRETQNKEIKQRVDQMRSDFESSQMSLEKSLEFGRSVGDLTLVSPLKGREFMSVADVSSQNRNTPNFSVERMQFLERRVKQLEADLKISDLQIESEQVKALQSKILDLQENLKEQECVIQARTQAVSLMSENMSLKGKNTVDLLEDTKHEMFKMQTNFLHAEDDLKQEIERLQVELEDKSCKIANLEEMTNILETARYDLTVENSEIKAQLSDVAEYSTKISELNKLNQTLQHRISDLEQQKYEFITEDEAQQARQASTANKSPADQKLQEKIEELEQQNADLQKTIDEFESDAEVQRKVEQLQQTIEAQKQELTTYTEEMAVLQDNLQEKTVELNVLNANFSVLQEKLKQSGPKSLFPSTENEEGIQEIAKLKQQLDESNKSMIKSKLKIKQLQKQIDSYKKTSNVHQEVSRLTEENQTLRQKLTELEEEKGNLQLHLVNYDGSLPDSELEQRIKILETTCQNQTNAIQLLEEQKIEVAEDLTNTRSELTTLKDQIVISADNSATETTPSPAALDLSSTADDTDNLNNTIEDLEKTINQLQKQCRTLESEKKVLNEKLDHYMNENIELLDKVEKLSKGSSSAESIEIVESLTQQEKNEIEEFQKNLDAKDEAIAAGDRPERKDDFDNNEIGDELNDSLVKLREESSELMYKIELFTTERREVLDKLEAVKTENLKYAEKNEVLEQERTALKIANEKYEQEKLKLEEMLEKAEHDKQQLQNVLKEYQDNKLKIKEATATLQQEVCEETVEAKSASSSTQSSPMKSATSTIDRATYESALKALDTEIQNYQKNKDKNSKLRISKKLQTEAKNTHTMMTNVLGEYFRSVGECDTLQAEVLEWKGKAEQAKKADASDEQLQAIILKNAQLEQELRESLEHLSKKEEKIEHLHKCVDQLENELAEQKNEFDNRVSDALTELKTDLTGLLEQIASKNKEITKLNTDNRQLTDELNGAALNLTKLRGDLTARMEVSANEVTVLKELVAEQKAQLIATFEEHEADITEKMKTINDFENQVVKLQSELEAVRADHDSGNKKYVEGLKSELKTLQDLLRENESQIQMLTVELTQKQTTIETLNQQIIDLYRQMEENSNKLIEREDEVQYLQEIIDSNTGEMKKLSSQQSVLQREITDLQATLSKTNIELERVKQTSQPTIDVQSLQQKVKNFEARNCELETKNREQLEKLKKFAANLKKKVAQCAELESRLQKVEVDGNVESEVASLKEQLAKYDAELITLRHENSRLEVSDRQQQAAVARTAEISEMERRIQHLQSELQTADANNSDLEWKLKRSEARLDDLEAELVDSTNEMAHMDKKFKEELSAALSDKHVRETLLKEREEQIVTLRTERDEAQKNFAEKSSKFEKSKALIKEKMKEVVRQQTLVKDLEIKLETSQKEHEETLTYRSELQQQISALQGQQQVLSEDGQKTLQLEMQIEQIELENVKLRNQIVRLEDGLANIEERRSSLELQKNLLGAELREKECEFTENEDVLLQRLNALTQHDEAIERKLQETADENIEISESLKEMTREHEILKNKYSVLQEEIKQLETGAALTSDFEVEITSLKKQLLLSQTDLKRIKQDFEKQLQSKHTEVDELEAELSSQLQKVEDEKKLLQEEMERTGEKNTELLDEIVRLKEQVHGLEQVRVEWERDLTWMRMQNDNFTHETDDLRVQMLQYQTEIDDLKHSNETLQTQHEHEVNTLKQQLSDMESMNRLAQLSQHQTDDQVILQNENLKLKATLAEKEEEIRQHQSLIQHNAEVANLNQRIQSLEHQLGHSTQELLRIQAQLQEIASESLRKDHAIEQLQTRHQKEVQNLQQLIVSRDTELHTSQQFVVQMQEICATKNDEIGKLRSLTHTPEPAMLIVESSSRPSVASLAQQTRDEYVHDLEKRTKNLNIMHDDYLQQLQDKMKQIEELQREVQHYEERVEALEAVNRNLGGVSKDETDEQPQVPPPQIASFFGAPDTSVSVFEQQLFGAPTHQPFDSWGLQPVQEMSVQKHVTSSAAPKPPPTSNANELQLQQLVDNLQSQLQTLQAEQAATTAELNERNEKIKEFHNLIFEYQQKVECLEQVIKTHEADIQKPVQEEVIVPKEAYLCYPEKEHKETQTIEVECTQASSGDWGWNYENVQVKVSEPLADVAGSRIEELEAQLREVTIISDDHQNELERRNKKLEKLNKMVFEYQEKVNELEASLEEAKQSIPNVSTMSTSAFFGGSDVNTEFDQQIGGATLPAIEDECVKKKAYLCYDDKDTQTSFDEPIAMVEEVVSQQTASIVNIEFRKKTEECIDLQQRISDLEAQLKATLAQHAETNKELERRNKKFEKLNRMVFDYQTKINELQELIQKQPATEQQPPPQNISSLSTALFFGAAPPDTSEFDTVSDNRVPVVEEIIVPKKAYVCHPEDVPQETTGEEGWGWGDDAILEEQHQQMSVPTQSSAPNRLRISPTVEAELKLREKDDRIADLEKLVAQADQQTVDLNKKVEKLMKKLKEYKMKLVEYEKGFRKSSSVESNELDLAIQEELNRQVASLETKMKELKTDMDKVQAEKESLSKRNEVLASANDRMTEMKERQDSQMEIYQTKVKQLSSKLEQLDNWGDEEPAKKEQPAVLPSQPTPAPNQSNAELESLIRDLQVDNEEFQALLEEEKANNEILETRIRQFQATQVTMQDAMDSLEEQLKKSGLARDKLASELEAKNQEIRDLISKIDILSEESGKIRDSLELLRRENQSLSTEVQQLATQNAELCAEIDRVQASSKLHQQSIPEFSASADPQKIEELEQKLNSLTGQLQYKDAETAQLNQRIQEVLQADQTESLVNEILLKNQEINNLRKQNNAISMANIELESNLSLQLTNQMQKVSDDQEASKTWKLEKQVNELKAEKFQMEQELQVLNDQVISSLTLEDRMKEAALLVDTKNIEIIELKNSLQQLQQQGGSTTTDGEQLLREHYETQLAQMNEQWNALVESRGNEVATMWKQHLDMREAEFQQTEQALRKEIENGRPTDGQQTRESSVQSTDSNSELVKNMQVALENQELEIVTLKEQLAIRSAEYARIAAQLDPYGKFATSELQKKPPVEVKPPAVPTVSRAELDLAHYMLHQRDMRCEELTMELISLLEERDTLQLRLSNSLRQTEEIKRRAGPYDADISESSDVSQTTTPEKLNQSVDEQVVGSSRTESQQTTDLNYKISELQASPQQQQQPERSIREQQLREEREHRYRQMNLLQRDLSNMPAEAVATLIASTDTSKISSTEGASSSSVLLNWFLNRTATPAPTQTTYTQQQRQQQHQPPPKSSTITQQPPFSNPQDLSSSTHSGHQSPTPNT